MVIVTLPYYLSRVCHTTLHYNSTASQSPSTTQTDRQMDRRHFSLKKYFPDNQLTNFCVFIGFFTPTRLLLSMKHGVLRSHIRWTSLTDTTDKQTCLFVCSFVSWMEFDTDCNFPIPSSMQNHRYRIYRKVKRVRFTYTARICAYRLERCCRHR